MWASGLYLWARNVRGVDVCRIRILNELVLPDRALAFAISGGTCCGAKPIRVGHARSYQRYHRIYRGLGSVDDKTYRSHPLWLVTERWGINMMRRRRRVPATHL